MRQVFWYWCQDAKLHSDEAFKNAVLRAPDRKYAFEVVPQADSLEFAEHSRNDWLPDQPGAHVVHIAAHGGQGHGILMVRDGHLVACEAKALAKTFGLALRAGAPLECIVLQACESVGIARELLKFLAQKKSQAALSIVFWRGRCKDSHCKVGSRAFYQALNRSPGDYLNAYENMENTVSLEPDAASDRWRELCFVQRDEHGNLSAYCWDDEKEMDWIEANVLSEAAVPAVGPEPGGAGSEDEEGA
eukprot:TRINITY_DN5328_c0_g1_i5.p3 TRINITY_DN5328_c0_g1~~TRINITY_DN5328_c0_g1_i5.p3  ORF type:complete len:246 (-),score=58.42 TRINITY_DN5328_c0_g1_i5:293-1030(-)